MQQYPFTFFCLQINFVNYEVLKHYGFQLGDNCPNHITDRRTSAVAHGYRQRFVLRSP